MAEMKFKRINDLENFIRENGSASNELLIKKFGISMQTLRRDINVLVKKGTVRKVYGGVLYKTGNVATSVPSADSRHDAFQKEKEAIGKKAASLVKDGNVIFIDSGTTTCRMIPYLASLQNITVITHSLIAAEMLAGMEGIRLIQLGGELNRTTGSFCIDAQGIPYRFDQAFIATVGIDQDGCTNTNIPEGRIKRYALQHSDSSYLLLDHSKFETRGFNKFAEITDFNAIITDGQVPSWLQQLAKKKQVTIMKGEVQP